MSNINLTTITGNLGSKPELLQSKNGKQYTRASIAHSTFKKNEGAEPTTTTSWFDIIAFDYSAKILSELNKGDKVLIEGKLEQKYYEKDDGTKKNSVYLVVYRVLKVDNVKVGNSATNNGEYQAYETNTAPPQQNTSQEASQFNATAALQAEKERIRKARSQNEDPFAGF